VTTFKRVKATTYTVKNNSTEKGNLSKRLYIDHTASSAQGGYTIITTDKSAKVATGFARYEFFLRAQEELKWTVLEEVVHDIEMTCHTTVKSILKCVLQPSSKLLVEDGALTEDVKTELLNYLRDENKRALLNRINNNSLTSQELMQLQNHNKKEKEEDTDKTAEASDDQVDLEDALGMELIRSMVERHAAQFKKEEMERAIATHHAHIKGVHANQSRLRENIKSMEKVASSKLVDRYLVDLDKEEDDLIHTRQIITALEEQIAALEREVERLDTIVEMEVNRLLKMY
jgi:paraquat-inducible protein B